MARHPGYIERRGDSFRVTLTVGGQRHRFTLSDVDREEAETIVAEKYAALRRMNGRGLPGPMAFSELLDRYQETKVPRKSQTTQKTYGNSLKAFRTYFVKQGGDPKVHEVRPGHVEGFLDWRETHRPDGTRCEPRSARTLAKGRATLHSIFAYAETLEIVQSNPVAKTKPPKGDAREPLILTPDQFEALLTACEGRPMLRMYVLLLNETGLRCESEALWLRWEDLDLKAGFLTVEGARKGRRTKSGKSRKVPMTRRLREAVRDHMAAFRLKTYHGKPTPWVFHHETDRGHGKAGERYRSLREAFEGAAKRAGLPRDLHQHDLRHRRVTTWLQEGQPIHLVRDAMGHSTVQVTERYLHLVASDLLRLVEAPSEEELREMVTR